MMRLRIFITLGVSAFLGAVFAGLALLPPKLVPPQSNSFILTGVTVLNPGIERVPDQTIVVESGRIVEVRPRHSTDPAPICEGCIAMPGLIDAHVHTPPKAIIGNQELFSLLYLAHGVTSVRDVGETDNSIPVLARRLNSARLIGPHMYRCGRVIESAPASWPAALVVETAEEASAAVDQIADSGADCIKVYNELNLDAFGGVIAAAEQRGLPVLGHVPHAVGLMRVVDFESQHMTGLPYVDRPRPALNMDIHDADVLAMTEEEVERILDVAVANRVSFTPTLANLSLRLSASDPARFPPPAARENLPEFWSTVWQSLVGHPTGEAEIEQRLQSVARYHQIVGEARARGVDVLAGTDTLMPWVTPGASLHQEIEELALAFNDNEAALVAATRINGQHIAPGEVGVIAPGMRADILLLNEDPVADLSALTRWCFVAAGGRLYSREAIDAAVKRYRHHFHGKFYSWTMNWIVSIVAGDAKHTNG
jgi:hypothetical protein